MKQYLLGQAVFLLVAVLPATAQQYSAHKKTSGGVEIVELSDSVHRTTVSIAPSVGNNAYEMRVNGKNVFWFPYDSVSAFRDSPKLCGNPFLAPWANRLDEDGFYANGNRYTVNPALSNLRRDGNNLPIHGLLLFASEWEVTAAEGDARGARVASRLDFWRHANLMAHFPFAHTIEMTYILREGALEVRTRITNAGAQPMPLLVGYHPYFQLHDAPRDEWTVSLGADLVWKLNDKLVPTGETQPVRSVFPNPSGIQLGGALLDHVFGGLIRDGEGRAHFSVTGGDEKIEVIYGPNYNTAIVYAPPGEDRRFICFEPMTGITNAFNLAHRGVYKELQTIPPGGVWQESFWIRPSGF